MKSKRPPKSKSITQVAPPSSGVEGVRLGLPMNEETAANLQRAWESLNGLTSGKNRSRDMEEEDNMEKKNGVEFGIRHATIQTKNWRKTRCVQNVHAFEEVTTAAAGHHLRCSACLLIVKIAAIDTTFVPNDVMEALGK